jgi:hypothetical protein
MNVQMCSSEAQARAAIKEFALDFERSEKPNPCESMLVITLFIDPNYFQYKNNKNINYSVLSKRAGH